MRWRTLPEAADELGYSEDQLWHALEGLREKRDPFGQGTLMRRLTKQHGGGVRIEYRQEDIEEAVALATAKTLGYRE